MRATLLLCFFLTLGVCEPVYADTPPPGTVKAKTYSGDGNTAITATGSSLNVNVTNATSSTVNQGAAGTDPWFVSVRNNAPLPVNACQETGGNLASILSALQGTLTVNASGHTVPIFAASLPLPTGASTSAKQPALGTAGTPSADVITVQGHSGMTPIQVDGSAFQATVDQGDPGPSASPWPVILEPGSTTAATQSGTWSVAVTSLPSPVPIQGGNSSAVKVDGSAVTQPVSGTFFQATQPVSGTFWQTTQPVSAASLPLPSGASTAAKQPALGTAGSASSDVITVQGVTSMTALKVDGSGVTQPISGTVTANAGTNLNTSALALDATLTGGTQQSKITDGTNVATVKAASTAAGATDKALVVAVSPNNSVAVTGTFFQATQPVSGTFFQATQPVSISAALPAGTNIIGKVGIDQTTPGTTNLVALAANQSVNVAQINGVTPLMGNGTTGTGSQRVTIASDNTAFSVNATPKTPAALTVKQAAVSIGTSAVRLTNDGSAPPSTRVLLAAQLISSSTANCYFGSSGVTTTSTTRGVQFFSGQTLSFSNDAGDYYAICDSAAQTIYITEQE